MAARPAGQPTNRLPPSADPVRHLKVSCPRFEQDKGPHGPSVDIRPARAGCSKRASATNDITCSEHQKGPVGAVSATAAVA